MVTDEPSETAIVEERKELMVPATHEGERQRPTIRTAHFLKPTLDLISSPPFRPKLKLPFHSLSLKHKAVFHGIQRQQKAWKTWVERMRAVHEPIWRKVGICDAINASTYHILRQNQVLISLAQKWCPEFNTFIFPWGEATVTLEDIMHLGGFSVVGESVLSLLSQGQYVEHLENNLSIAKRQIKTRIKPNVSHYSWLKHFMSSGDELEHVSFLALWLSRYVFPQQYIADFLFPIAARLSHGIKIALAPAVLANIYRDLSLLRDKILCSSRNGCNIDASLVLLAPFQMVQLWAWERFPTLAPIPRMLLHGEPRLARWSNLKKHYKIGGLYAALDSAREAFLWRPYARVIENLSFHCSYGDTEKWVSVDSGGQWESFSRCVRVCRIAGLDCVENYNPHRVGMQFGMDQDVPCSVYRVHDCLETTWKEYNRPIEGVKLYVPSRLFKGCVTTLYSDWWNGVSVSQHDDSFQIYKRRRTAPCSSNGKNDRQNLVEMLIPCDQKSEISFANGSPKMNNEAENDGENPIEMLQVCDERNAEDGDAKCEGKKQVCASIVSISDEDEAEEDINDFLFESFPLEMDARIKKLEGEVSRLTKRLKFDQKAQNQHPIKL